MLVEDHWKMRPGRELAKANGDSSLRPTACMESWRKRDDTQHSYVARRMLFLLTPFLNFSLCTDTFPHWLQQTLCMYMILGITWYFLHEKGWLGGTFASSVIR